MHSIRDTLLGQGLGYGLGDDHAVPSGPPATGEITMDQQAALAARGYRVKRPRFSKPDVRMYSRSVLHAEARYDEVSDGRTVRGQVTAPGLRPLQAECKVGEENRMRTGFIRALSDGKVRDGLVP